MLANISYGQQNTAQHNVLAMVSKKKSRGKARRAAKAAKAAADEEAQQSDEPEPEHESPPQMQLKAEEEEDEEEDHYEDNDENHDEDNDHDHEEEDHDDSLQIRKITPTVTIDEATGGTCLSFCLAVVNGRLTPIRKKSEQRLTVEEQRTLTHEKREDLAVKCDHGCH